jgi:hypothetical protein
VDFVKSQEIREKISAEFKEATVELDISYGRVKAN